MTTRRDPLAETLRAALDAEPLDLAAPSAPAVSADDDALLARAIDRAMASTLTAVAPSAPPSGAPSITASVAPSASASAAPPVLASLASTASPASTGSLRSLGSARQARARSRVLRYALPAAAAFAASVAMAAVYINYRAQPVPSNDLAHPPSTAAPETSSTAGTGRSAPAAAPPARVTPPAGEGAPTISIDDLPSVTPHASGAQARSDRPRAGSEPGSANANANATAAELFRDANTSRRAGEVEKAVELYSALVARHADTPEALAARVSLGRLLLDRRGDTAGALVQFDAYLRSSSSDRALAEEARLGRALVFQRQGRQEEERRAWHELLERHPDSLYASRARERLAVLAPATPSP